MNILTVFFLRDIYYWIADEITRHVRDLRRALHFFLVIPAALVLFLTLNSYKNLTSFSPFHKLLSLDVILAIEKRNEVVKCWFEVWSRDGHCPFLSVSLDTTFWVSNISDSLPPTSSCPSHCFLSTRCNIYKPKCNVPKGVDSSDNRGFSSWTLTSDVFLSYSDLVDGKRW